MTTEIKDIFGTVLLTVEGNTLKGADLRGVDLR